MGLDEDLVGAIQVLADDLGLIEGPLIGRLLLGEQHLLHRVLAAEARDGQHDRVDGGQERDPTAEGLVALLGQLVGIGQLDLSHGLRSTTS